MDVSSTCTNLSRHVTKWKRENRSMNSDAGKGTDNPQILMEIIRAQTDIAQFGPELGRVMDSVTEPVQGLTGADGAIVELAEGEQMIYRAASGMARHQLGLRLQRNGSLSGLCVRQRHVRGVATIRKPTPGPTGRLVARSDYA